MTVTTAERAAETTDAATPLTDAELLAWAREAATRWRTDTPPVVVFWSGPMDNFVPARKTAHGYAVIGPGVDGTLTMSLRTRGMVRDGHRAVYVVDDGKTAIPMYAGSYNRKGEPDQVTLKGFAVNPDGRRDDRGRVVDNANWWVGPTRFYHIKIVPVPSGVTL